MKTTEHHIGIITRPSLAKALIAATAFFLLHAAKADLIDVDQVLAHATTAEEKALVDADIQINTAALDGLTTLPIAGSPGTVPVTTVKNRVYNLLLLAKQLTFSRPLPWTDQSLYGWIIDSCDKITLSTTAGVSYAIPANREIVIAMLSNSYLLNTDRWMNQSSGGGLANTLVLFIHEIRHLNGNGGYPHTSGSNDATLQEAGSWGVQYYSYKLLANYSNWTNSIVTYTASQLNYAATSALGRIANTNLTLGVPGLSVAGNVVSISFTSPQPFSTHELLSSADLTNWQSVTVTAVQHTGQNKLTVAADCSSNQGKGYYRVRLNGL